MPNINLMSASSGRLIKEDNTIINKADLIAGNTIVFIDDSDGALVSDDLLVGGYKNMTIEITGSVGNSARTVEFYAKGLSGTLVPLAGVNISTFAIATSTTGKGEIWQFDITGLDYIVIDLNSITGGTVRVEGRVIA